MPEEEPIDLEGLFQLIIEGINSGSSAWERGGSAESVVTAAKPNTDFDPSEVVETVGMSPLEVVVSAFYKVNYPHGMQGDNREEVQGLCSRFENMRDVTYMRFLHGQVIASDCDRTALLMEAQFLDLSVLASGTDMLFQRVQRQVGRAIPETPQAEAARRISDRYSRFQEVSAWAAGQQR